MPVPVSQESFVVTNASDALNSRRSDPASFRDPSGFVYRQDGEVRRQVNLVYADAYDELMRSGLAAHLIDRGLLIRHEECTDPPPHPSAYKIIRPEAVPFISYPYEWCFSELKDAALLTLRVQAQALKFGMSLKDASAYNVQFLRGKPILIDTLSFEHYREGEPWVAYRQFCQHFLAPLALMAYRDARLNQLFRTFIDGTPLDLASALLPLRTRLRPALAFHVHFHSRLQKKYGDNPSAAKTQRGRLSRQALTNLLENLAAAVRALSWNPSGTEWADYYDNTNYADTSLDEKARVVDAMLDASGPGMVWDLGANTGRFSRLASGRGLLTLAFDIDPAAVEKNYRTCVASGEANLLPLVLDLTNPSNGIGWAGQERASLADRGPAHVVLSLALIHHLAIGNNVPLGRVAEFMAGLTEHLIIEFVPKSDSQVQRLLASRTDIFEDYTEEGFETAFGQHFSVLNKHRITGTERTLFHMQARR